MTPSLVNAITAMWAMILVGVGALYLLAYKHAPIALQMQVLLVGLGICAGAIALLFGS